jgi:predicted AAA+ superfamily ATPase
MFEYIIEIHELVTNSTPRAFSRVGSLDVDWTAPVIGLTGARGVGKTTLLLQKYWEIYGSSERCLYISADHVHVTALGIYNIGREFFKRGGEALIIDEAHRATDWTAEIKSLIDTYPKKVIWISGSSSSAMAKGHADLSRRVLWYDLPGLSFREYLQLTGQRDIGRVSLDDLLKRHVAIARDLAETGSLLQAFRGYLKHGHYPFFLQGLGGYHQRVQSIIDKVVSEDLTSEFAISAAKVNTLKKILWIVSSTVPLQLNIESLSRSLGIAKVSTYHFLDCLVHGRLLQTVMGAGRGVKSTRKPEKLYLENTNLMAAITAPHRVEPSIGTVRETFFCNALRARHSLKSLGDVDFLVDDRVAVEVGGPGKGDHQLRAERLDAKMHAKAHRVLAVDGIEAGSGQRIPLHLFGLLR